MKLSQLSTKVALNKMLMLIPVIKELVNDKKILEVWKKGYKIKPNSSALEIEIAKQEANNEKIFGLLSLLLEEHENAIYKILSIMSDKKIEEVEKQPITDTILQIEELLSDKELMQLFTTQKV